MTNPHLLRVNDLKVAFGRPDNLVVKGVSLTVNAGERVSIVGQSGSGKSTVIGAVLGLLPAGGSVEAGSILLAGDELLAKSESQLQQVRGRRIGLVPQDPGTNLNPAMRVGDQVADALRADGVSDRRALEKRVVALLSEAGIPQAERRRRQYPHEFSGGMRQRVLIAIALSREPELLIADEPTSALDVTVQRQILDHLEALVSARGMAMLMVTHDLGLAADRSDKVIVMSDGLIEESGTPDEILLQPRRTYTQRLIAAAPSLGSLPTASQHAGGMPEERGKLATPILSVERLSKQYPIRGGNGILHAVKELSFKVEAGTTTAIVGESGSGKTTTARMILGLEPSTNGASLLDGADITSATGRQRKEMRRRMQPVFQDPFGSLDPTYTIERLIEEPLRLYRVGDRRTRRKRVGELLDQVALSSGLAHRRPRELSGGQRQRVAIARALALEPDLVVCDEAVSALDVLVQAQVLELLASLQRDLGVSYLFITHDLAVVRQIAHQVVVMRAGEAVEIGEVSQIFTDARHEYTHELLAAIPGRHFFERDKDERQYQSV
ncbi:dipeptide ABC transporter ATP-binding protein [Nocardioides houyundeii]|uniref:dipeptide ABC transporter ATP-binding protein n=1 Tax=Nocardioides houyundeii TaxID=2045452 RepID=UPI000DF484BD|nr:ABC transporter ATP-binding protein [Nocardioides houyundeii]